jgi:hypothetical protein
MIGSLNPAYAIEILLRPKTAAKSKLLLLHHRNLLCFSHKNSAFIAVLAFTTNPIAYSGLKKFWVKPNRLLQADYCLGLMNGLANGILPNKCYMIIQKELRGRDISGSSADETSGIKRTRK